MATFSSDVNRRLIVVLMNFCSSIFARFVIQKVVVFTVSKPYLSLGVNLGTTIELCVGSVNLICKA